MLGDGFHDVPAGKVAAIVTSLEMFAHPGLRPEAYDPSWTLDRLEPLTIQAYRDLYTAVGQDWLWFMRLRMADADLETLLADPDVEVYRLNAPDEDQGILELDFRQPETCELAFFGVTRGLIGGAAARWLMNRAIERAWSRPIRRFWVHTCTFDHPNAPNFYIRSGFRPFRRDVEIHDDPRLDSLAPLESAPHIPVIRPA